MQQNKPEAFVWFVDTFGGRILGLSRRYTRCEADAEDLSQEIFVEIVRSIGQFRGRSSLSTWVYRIAMNHCLKHQQRRQPDTLSYDDTLHETPDTTASPAESAERTELRGQVSAAIGTLSSGHRDVVILHELHGLTYSECAEVLQIPIGTVKSRLSNAFGRLRDQLGAYVTNAETSRSSFTKAEVRP